MADFVNTIPQICLTANLPDVIEIETDVRGAVVQMKVYVNNTIILTTEIYALGTTAYIYDIRSIIENRMRSEDLANAMFDIVITEEQDSSSNGGDENHTGPSLCIMSEKENPQPLTWMQSHFLTARTTQRISKTGKQLLGFFTQAGEMISTQIIGHIRQANGSYIIDTWQIQAAGIATTELSTMEINMPAIISHFENLGELLYFDVTKGNRKVTFFISDEDPQMTFRFRNNFNILEYAEIFGVTVHKVKMSKSDASILRKKVQYDFEKEEEYEVETSYLSRMEAEGLTELLLSRKTEIKTENNIWKPVLTDGEGEISDKRNAENRLKFTYQFEKI